MQQKVPRRLKHKIHHHSSEALKRLQIHLVFIVPLRSTMQTKAFDKWNQLQSNAKAEYAHKKAISKTISVFSRPK